MLAQSAKVASVSVQAVPPDKKSSPKVALNTALSPVTYQAVLKLADEL